MSGEAFDAPFDPPAFDPATFSGVARLFPLPAPSLFPRVVQPLHVFEERYREMMRDALDSDGLIAMAVLKPGWEPDYASRPPLEEIACLGSIVTHHRLEDGRYNLLLAGVTRVRLIEEIEPPVAFRRARVELLSEITPPPGDPRAVEAAGRIAAAFRRALPTDNPPPELEQLLSEETPLGLLADLAAYTLPLPKEVKQAALAELDVVRRATKLVEAFGGPTEADPEEPETPPRGFPPPFSSN